MLSAKSKSKEAIALLISKRGEKKVYKWDKAMTV